MTNEQRAKELALEIAKVTKSYPSKNAETLILQALNDLEYQTQKRYVKSLAMVLLHGLMLPVKILRG